MSLTRPKLILDEQAFEGLLAAAFTIQQHNDRQKRSSDPTADKARSLPGAPELCAHCAAPLPTEAATCSVCGAEDLRPGERLQRTWASLWQMSQERSVRHVPPETDAADAAAPPFYRDGNGLHATDSTREVAPPTNNEENIGANAPMEAANPVANFFSGHPSRDEYSIRIPAPDLPREEMDWPPEHTDHFRSDFPSAALSKAEHAVRHDGSADDLLRADRSLDHLSRDDSSLAESSPNDFALVDSPPDGELLTDSSLADSWLEDPALADIGAEAPSPTPDAGSGLLARLRATLSLDRADFYVAIAFVVAAIALLWPTATSSRHHLSPWERVLVAIGVAETPPPAIHYRGDPEIKVWVDPHTALYYCPGDELYGKSPDGHYTTQHEAQADRFEPAQRSACIQ